MKRFEKRQTKFTNKDGSYASQRDVRKENDPMWYAINENAIKNMATFPFLEIVGDPYFDDVPAALIPDSTPPIVVGMFSPTAGNFFDSSDKTISRASDKFFNDLGEGYSASIDVEATDLMMAVIAGANLMAMMMTAKRAYGLLHTFELFNKGYARHILSALGFDYDSLVDNQAQFRTDYNQRVSQINSILKVPHDFSLLQRWTYVHGGFFTDTQSPAYSTAYALVPSQMVLYDATSAKTGTCLKYYPAFHASGAELLTPDDFWGKIDHALDALNDSDVRTIFGAIKKIYDDSAFARLTELEEGYTTPIWRSDSMQMEWHNAHFLCQGDLIGYCPDTITTDSVPSFDTMMYQTARGQIITRPLVYAQGNPDTEFGMKARVKHDIMIDMYDHLVSPGNLLDATAFQFGVGDVFDVDNPFGGTTSVVPIFPRCEVITELVCWNNFEGAVSTDQLIFPACLYNLTTNPTTTISNIASSLEAIRALSHFDSHPLLPTVQGTSAYPFLTGFIGEIDKYTTISHKVISKLNNTTQWKLMSLPANTRSVTQ